MADDPSDGVSEGFGFFALGDDAEELFFVEVGLRGPAVVLKLEGGGELLIELVGLDGAFG